MLFLLQGPWGGGSASPQVGCEQLPPRVLPIQPVSAGAALSWGSGEGMTAAMGIPGGVHKEGTQNGWLIMGNQSING